MSTTVILKSNLQVIRRLPEANDLTRPIQGGQKMEIDSLQKESPEVFWIAELQFEDVVIED